MFFYYFIQNPWIPILLSIVLIVFVAFMLIAFSKIQEAQNRKTNPLIASDIPDWSEIPMEYNYID